MVWFVRLACLMCAASVYPEPGSNSLVFIWVLLKLFFFFIIFFGTFLFWNYRLVSFSLKVLLFTFQCTFFSLFSIEDDLHYTIPFSFCQYFFLIIFYFFLPSFRQNKKLVILVFFLFFLSFFITNFFRFFFFFCCLLGTFLYYHILSFLVNTFWLFFSSFFFQLLTIHIILHFFLANYIFWSIL